MSIENSQRYLLNTETGVVCDIYSESEFAFVDKSGGWENIVTISLVTYKLIKAGEKK